MFGLHTLGCGAKALPFTPAAQPERSHSHSRPTAQQVSLFMAACATLRMRGLGWQNPSVYQTTRVTQRQYGPNTPQYCPASNVLEWHHQQTAMENNFSHDNLFLSNVGVNCSTLGSSTLIEDSPTEVRAMYRCALLLCKVGCLWSYGWDKHSIFYLYEFRVLFHTGQPVTFWWFLLA